MALVPPFLQALELDTDADERAIRRAYARRLKRIDPQADPEAFQALRENFEAALKWVEQPQGLRVMHLLATPEPSPAPAPRAARPPVAAAPSAGVDVRMDVPETPGGGFSWTMDDAKGAVPDAASEDRAGASPAPAPVPARAFASAPARGADQAGGRTPGVSPAAAPATARTPLPAPRPIPATAERPAAVPASSPEPAPRAAARPLSVAPQDAPADRVFSEFADRFTRTASDEADATRLLREALADPRLVNLEARTRFEGHVARLLAGGWRPGHEHLFKPACDVFEWEIDRRRLEVFDADGKVLDAAVRERLIFFAQPAVVFEAQKALIRRLRKDRPSAREIAPEIKLLALMTQRFPHWLRVMTRAEIVQHWIDSWNALTDDDRAAASSPPASAPAPARAPVGAIPRPPTRAPERPSPTRMPPPLPPVQPYAAPPRSSFGGFNAGSVGTRWMIGACVLGVLRFFGSLGHPSPPAPPDPAPYVESLGTRAAPPQPAPTAADRIRALANQGQQAMPEYSSPSPDGTDPIEAARQQMRADALARQQAQTDPGERVMLPSKHPKKARWASAQEGPVDTLPDVETLPGQ